MKRDKYDTVFSDLIRESYDYVCTNCERSYRHNTSGLHCSHVFGRRKQSVRYDIDNAMAHCVYCHRHLGENPIDFTLHYIAINGEGLLNILREKSNRTKKWLKGEKDEMHKHYKAELARIKQLRMDGVQGYIQPVNWS